MKFIIPRSLGAVFAATMAWRGSGALRIECAKEDLAMKKHLRSVGSTDDQCMLAAKCGVIHRNSSTGPPHFRYGLSGKIGIGGIVPRRPAQMVRPRRTVHGISWVLAALFIVTGPVLAAGQSNMKLIGADAVGPAEQGWSVAISADGKTAIVGGPVDNRLTGAAWVYTRSGDLWTQQGGKLVGTGKVGQAGQGISVALSADGNTAIVGGPYDDRGTGAVWIIPVAAMPGPSKVASWLAPGRLDVPLKAPLSRSLPTAIPPSSVGERMTRPPVLRGFTLGAVASGASKASSWSALVQLERPDRASPSRCLPTAIL